MKITLRKPQLSDLNQFHKIFNDKEMAKQLSGYSYPSTILQSKKKLQEIISKNEKGNYYEFAIIVNKNFVGSV
ncbi:MAG: GNAT family N-acetyltransferase, partial [Candidatus Pacearchaeota archaeon]|nr:GNAT family N-acetyltransferase [Candidatus Pacearchaeota archaeon]